MLHCLNLIQKFDSGCGWPSFFLPKDKETISEVPDYSHGMSRIEVKCKQCDAPSWTCFLMTAQDQQD